MLRSLACLALLLSLCATALAAPAAPKNIILMISDGCGFGQIEATSLYEYGAADTQPYDRFPVKLAVSTFSTNGGGYDAAKAWSDFSYAKAGATDSAASATAMACGVKTYDAAIGVGPDKLPRENWLERAEELGKATGVITSVQFSHATPAGFAAHNVSRNSYAEIAAEMFNKGACEVVMGCGHPYFDGAGKYRTVPADAKGDAAFGFVGGRATWEALVAGVAGADADADGLADPWKLIQTRDEFVALGAGPTPKRVVGVPQVDQTLQNGRPPAADVNADGTVDGKDAAAEAPFTTPLIATVPTLAEMTRGALNVLDNDSDGLALMIEGGAVDWASHSHQTGRMIEEQMDFNAAVAAVVAWVETHGGWDETLLIITEDHDNGYIFGPGSDPDWKPIIGKGKGQMPDLGWYAPSHTNALVPLYARGNGCERLSACATSTDPRRGAYLDNTDIARVAFSLLN